MHKTQSYVHVFSYKELKNTLHGNIHILLYYVQINCYFRKQNVFWNASIFFLTMSVFLHLILYLWPPTTTCFSERWLRLSAMQFLIQWIKIQDWKNNLIRYVENNIVLISWHPSLKLLKIIFSCIQLCGLCTGDSF